MNSNLVRLVLGPALVALACNNSATVDDANQRNQGSGESLSEDELAAFVAEAQCDQQMSCDCYLEAGPVGESDDADLRSAIEEFQCDTGLPVTGACDDATAARHIATSGSGRRRREVARIARVERMGAGWRTCRQAKRSWRRPPTSCTVGRTPKARST